MNMKYIRLFIIFLIPVTAYSQKELEKPKIITSTKTYDFVSSFENSLAVVRSDGRWGVINTGKEIVIPVIYDNVSRMSGGDLNFFLVKKNERFGIIDSTGKGLVAIVHKTGMDAINAIPRFHIVESNETLYSISKKYSVTVDRILDANPELDRTGITIGRKIKIPAN